MKLVRRYSVRLTLLALLVLLGFLVLYRIKDQQARAVTRVWPETVVGAVLPGSSSRS